MPPLLAFWANLHGGFLAGLGIVVIWGLVKLTGTLRRAYWREALGIGLVVTASGLATLINPYGVRLLTFLLRTATVPRPEINEWKPLTLTSLGGAVALLLMGIGLAGLIASRTPRRPGLVAVFVVLAVLPWSSARHLPLFALAVVVLAGEPIADVWNRARPPRKRGRGRGSG